jgi:hypothetical protein
MHFLGLHTHMWLVLHVSPVGQPPQDSVPPQPSGAAPHWPLEHCVFGVQGGRGGTMSVAVVENGPYSQPSLKTETVTVSVCVLDGGSYT